MSTFHAVVWLDHQEAHVLMFDRDHVALERIKSRSHHKHQGKPHESAGLFTDVAKVNWELHLPKMYNFWENILFYSANYSGSPMAVHKELHQKSTMNQEHFQNWNELFNLTVDKLFQGPKAEEIKNLLLR